MELKKNEHVNLERKRVVFFQLGLLVVGSFTLAAFTYKAPNEGWNKVKKVVAAQSLQVYEELDEIPKEKQIVEPPKEVAFKKEEPMIRSEQLPDEVLKLLANKMVLFKSNVAIKTGGLKTGEQDLFIDKEQDITGELIEFPLIDAKFDGGYTAMQAFIQKNIEFPEDAKLFGDEGTVHLSFVVEKDGSISHVHIERGVSPSIDKEAKRIVQNFPKWTPGQDAFGAVRTIVRLPIKFGYED